MNKSAEIEVSITKLKYSDFNQLEQSWVALENNASAAFFLSWKWIGTWVEQTIDNKNLFLLRATCNGNIVGLGIFVEHIERRHYFVKSTQWLLHRTGEGSYDQIWIENNDLLVQKENNTNIKQKMWCWLIENSPKVDEFIVNLYKFKNEELGVEINSNANILYSEPQLGYRVNLNTYENLENYLAKRSKNTRQKIKQSIKRLGGVDSLSFKISTSKAEQLSLLEKSKHWHINKWQETSTPSGFTNKHFESFHQQLVNSDHNTATTFIASLSQGPELLGTIYCYQYNQAVYFYLASLKPIDDNKIKLGLVMHSLLIEYLIERHDIVVYDFLAGDSQYKRSLSDYTDKYTLLNIQSKSLIFTLELQLKKLKQFLLKMIRVNS